MVSQQLECIALVCTPERMPLLVARVYLVHMAGETDRTLVVSSPPMQAHSIQGRVGHLLKHENLGLAADHATAAER